jgi:hypothetical protein
MGVYIRGMEMPTSCIACLLNFGEKRPEYGLTIYCPYSDGVISWRDKAFDNGRLASCGITPVPPHGRLIDARYIRDVIIQKWMDKAGDSHMYKCGMEDAYEVIRNAPTIIPAEEDKT